MNAADVCHDVVALVRDRSEAFWQSIWDYFECIAHAAQCRAGGIPHARRVVPWRAGEPRAAGVASCAGRCCGLERHHQRKRVLGEVRELSWPGFAPPGGRSLIVARHGCSAATAAAYLPNIPETIAACLACVSIGAVCVCAPDISMPAVLDLLARLNRRLIAVAFITVAGPYRSAVVAQLCADLPSVQHLLLVQTPFASQRQCSLIQ